MPPGANIGKYGFTLPPLFTYGRAVQTDGPSSAFNGTPAPLDGMAGVVARGAQRAQVRLNKGKMGMRRHGLHVIDAQLVLFELLIRVAIGAGPIVAA